MIHKNSIHLTTLELWRTHAGSKRDHQWKDHRSAKACARAWLGAPEGRMPAEIEEALAGHPDLGPIRSWSAEPEARVRFDAFGGEPANIDMLVTAEDSRGPLAIAIEAKADETFGGRVSEVGAAAEKRLEANPRSKGLARLDGLLTRFFGEGTVEDAALGGLRYQLLTLCAAALAHAEAVGADRAVALMHEFVTPATEDARHEANRVRPFRSPPDPPAQQVPRVLGGLSLHPWTHMIYNGNFQLTTLALWRAVQRQRT